jgi:hypothetical protein
MDEKLGMEIQEVINKNPNDSINELNKKIQICIDKYNNTGIDMFEGLSPSNMYDLLYSNWSNNIITINPNKYDGNDIPMVKQIKYFIKKVDELNGLELTKIGNLPPSIVKDIYNQKIIYDNMIETGITKLTTENDVDNITVMKIICLLAGIIKKRNNKITLTKSVLKEMDTYQFVEKILFVIFNKYNWAYFDSFNNEEIGQFGKNYTLYLLNKYGNEWKDIKFYTELYFKAFPELLEHDEIDLSKISYIHRTFNQILFYCGFIDFENKRFGYGNIRTTDIFKKYKII